MGCEKAELRALLAANVRKVLEERATVPESCGPEISPALARGRVVPFHKVETDGVKLIDDEWHVLEVALEGYRPARVGDAFDVMADKARGQHFTPGQVSIGRLYGVLVERYEAAGVKCSSLENVGGGGGGSGSEFIDAVVSDARQIEAMRRRIGGGVSMAVRRVRPSSRGTRRSIADRALVDGVCIAGKTVSEVLRDHGWAVKGQTVKAGREALAAALDRMIGPVRSGVVSVRSDCRSGEIWALARVNNEGGE